MEEAYTSPSTAENHTVSEKEQAKAPTTPEPRIATILPDVNSSPPFNNNFLATMQMVKNRKRTQPADIKADRKLTIIIGLEGFRSVNNLPNNIKKGAPGGCAT